MFYHCSLFCHPGLPSNMIPVGFFLVSIINLTQEMCRPFLFFSDLERCCIFFLPFLSSWGKPFSHRFHRYCPDIHAVVSDWAVVMVTPMYWGWMGEPLPTSSRAIIKCNLEQTAALICLDKGKAQVVDIAGMSQTHSDWIKTWLQFHYFSIFYAFLFYSLSDI